MNSSNVRCGAILRAYARSEDQYSHIESRLKKTICRLIGAGFETIVIVVWDSPLFPGICDYGGSFNKLRSTFKGNSSVAVIKNEGDNFVDGPNSAMNLLDLTGYTHGLMASMDVEVDVKTFLEEAVRVIEQKQACAVALPVEGTEELVRAGFINNAWCLWDIQALVAIGGFDRRDKGPAHLGDKYGQTITSYKSYAGVGECLALIRIRELFNRPVLSVLEMAARYPVPKGRRARNWEKNESKRKRVELLLADTGYTEDDFRGSVI